jgi:hypothetical protein
MQPEDRPASRMVALARAAQQAALCVDDRAIAQVCDPDTIRIHAYNLSTKEARALAEWIVSITDGAA